jgi:hypothetical protein
METSVVVAVEMEESKVSLVTTYFIGCLILSTHKT